MNLCLLYTFLYIYIVPPLGAFKSQLEGTYSISLLLYIVIDFCVYISIYIYIYILMFHRVGFVVFLHERSIPCQQFEKLFQTSVSFLPVRQDGRNPSGNTFPGSNF